METGTKLGRYEIRDKIGEGGMGEVFRAQDASLDRIVALKVLLAEFCTNSERVNRFKLEARSASALNHPNIITIYEIGEFDDRLFIATEFIEGETLRDKIDRREFTLFDSLKTAEQIATALSAAHEADIVHRDIKPENIMIRHDGYVKILDFGLAKQTGTHEVGNENETVELVKTKPGIVMGSVRYMSPEQARGKAIDERTDVWSLGVVLYEMLTGIAPFDGETVTDTLAKLIYVEPLPLSEYLPNCPSDLQRIMRRALQKKADERYQTIKDFALDLKNLRHELELSEFSGLNTRQNAAANKTLSLDLQTTDQLNRRSSENATKIMTAETLGKDFQSQSIELKSERRAHKIWRTALLAFVGLFALGGLAYYSSHQFTAKISPNTSFTNPTVTRISTSGKTISPSISPDGKYVVFVSQDDKGLKRMNVRQLSAESTIEVLPPTTDNYFNPTFSPDGSFIYYMQVSNGIGTLYQIPSLGGTPKKVVTDIDAQPAFSPDGKRIAFVRYNTNGGGLSYCLANIDGTNETTLFSTKDSPFVASFSGLGWSPDGENLITALIESKDLNINEAAFKIYSISLKDSKTNALNDKKWLGISSLVWLKDSKSFLVNGKETPASSRQIYRFEPATGEFSRVTNDVNDYSWLGLSADNSTLVTVKTERTTNFVSFNPTTKEYQQLTQDSKNNDGSSGLVIDPNGNLIFTATKDGQIQIFSMDETGKSAKQLTSEKLNLYPQITNDNKYLIFMSTRGNSTSIWRSDADGKNPLQLSKAGNYIDESPSVSPDGKFVLFTRQPFDGAKRVLMRVSIEGNDESPVFSDPKTIDYSGKVSPDGKKLLVRSYIYEANSSTGKASFHIFEFENGQAGKLIKELDIDKINEVTWSKDGKSLIYLKSEGTTNVWQMSIENGKESQLTNFTSDDIANYAWSNDGKRLIVARAKSSYDLILIKDAPK